MRVYFTIPGEPHGKGRPKFSTYGGRVTARTPEKTVVYENLVRLEYQRQCGDVRFEDNAQLAVTIDAYYTIPKSASKKKKANMQNGLIRPTKKPDCDNVIKCVLDSLNSIAYHDDAQVVTVECRKLYSETPRVEVEICHFDHVLPF